jgi:hypothetical protein
VARLSSFLSFDFFPGIFSCLFRPPHFLPFPAAAFVCLFPPPTSCQLVLPMAASLQRESAHDHRSLLLGMCIILLASWTGCDGNEDAGLQAPEESPPLRIFSVTPGRVVAGQTVIIRGEGFGSDPADLDVSFDGISALVEAISSAELEVIVPAGLSSGEVAVRVARKASGSSVQASVTLIETGPPFVSVSAGSGFTCGIVFQRGAHCWGFGTSGQLGIGTPLNHSPRPLAVAGGAAFESVSAGSAHACAVSAGGGAYCWGRNESGQLGNGAKGEAPAPVPVRTEIPFTSLAAGIFHTCGLDPAGRPYCWGRNDSGQLGDGTTDDRLLPTRVAGDLVFTTLTVGGFHACGLTPHGQAYCWGENRNGELGDGTRSGGLTPVQVAGGITFSSLSAGRAPPVALADVGEHTCGLTPAGQAYCWGFNAYGQLGNGRIVESLAPSPVVGTTVFRAISAGAFHTCGVSTSGEAACWGANDSGQLGSGAINPVVSVPVPVIGGISFTTVSAGGAGKSALSAVRAHTCGLTQAGIVFCWGRNSSGQLGSGSISEQSTPIPVTRPG